MSKTPIITIKNLKKKYGKKLIIDDLTMDIYPGEVFGFLGPNGAGKTTTIRMLLGLISMTAGEIYINNFNIKKDFEKAISYVGGIVENPDLYKHLTGYQNLVHYSRMYPNIGKKRIDEVVALVGLQNRINDKVKKYSLGMRQRLGVAQALLHSPSVLILDEPTNGLDPAGIHELRNQLRTLAEKENIAVFVSSHLLSEMQLMCDRVGIIQNGKLVKISNLSEILEDTEQNKTTILNVNPIKDAVLLLESLNIEYNLNENNKEIEVINATEKIPDIISKFSSEGIKVYSVKETQKSLEEKFLEMTGGEQIG